MQVLAEEEEPVAQEGTDLLVWPVPLDLGL
jgi:hypothetical protein